MIRPIRTVAIVGGTHGNEITGPHLLRHWQRHPHEVDRPGLATRLVLGNPKAFAENRRFIDHDLNRSFAETNLRDTDSPSYEIGRAVSLDERLGPKHAPKTDFLIDLHTSTSDCAAMLIVQQRDAFSLRLAAYITARVPQARIHLIPTADGDPPYLGSIARHCLGVEIGPVPQGVLRFDVYDLSRRVVGHALDFVHGRNTNTTPDLPATVEVFRFCEVLTYPGEGRTKDAMVHESLQGADYRALNPGDPLFRTLNGETIRYDGPGPRYPVFINEAAYYDQNVAMMLTEKETLSVPDES
ncbi:MAG: aspartoacylase [Burkholderiaceae bacterium]